MRMLLVTVALLAWAPSARAGDGALDQGRMSVGLGLNGGSGYFTVAGSFGYFALDRFRPGVAVAYTWHDFGDVSTHELATTASARYYLLDPRPVSPFVHVEGGLVYLAYGGALSEDHTFFSVGGSAGLLVLLTRHVGLEGLAGVVKYLGLDDVLVRRGDVDDGVLLRWSLGLTVVF